MVQKIVVKLADAEFDDFNILMDMLFSKDRSNKNTCTREDFKEFILTDMSVPVNVKDLDLFLKTQETLCKSQFF